MSHTSPYSNQLLASPESYFSRTTWGVFRHLHDPHRDSRIQFPPWPLAEKGKIGGSRPANEIALLIHHVITSRASNFYRKNGRQNNQNHPSAISSSDSDCLSRGDVKRCNPS